MHDVRVHGWVAHLSTWTTISHELGTLSTMTLGSSPEAGVRVTSLRVVLFGLNPCPCIVKREAEERKEREDMREELRATVQVVSEQFAFLHDEGVVCTEKVATSKGRNMLVFKMTKG